MFMTPFIIPVAGVVCVFAWMIVASIVSGVRGIVKHRNEVELKQMLVARGMSAEEIARVVEASSAGDDSGI